MKIALLRAHGMLALSAMGLIAVLAAILPAGFALAEEDIPLPALVGFPRALHVPSLTIHADVNAVGLKQDGTMEAPATLYDTGWYRFGARPGERGNAVIAGHLDSDAEPGVFWDLELLRPGDRIEIADAFWQIHTFIVLSTERKAENAALLRSIFGRNTASLLRLITCEGEWDDAQGTYRERVIVTASYHSTRRGTVPLNATIVTSGIFGRE